MHTKQITKKNLIINIKIEYLLITAKVPKKDALSN